MPINIALSLPIHCLSCLDVWSTWRSLKAKLLKAEEISSLFIHKQRPQSWIRQSEPSNNLQNNGFYRVFSNWLSFLTL